MEWIDDTVAIGSWVDHRAHERQKREGIELSMNARCFFDQTFFSVGRLPDVAKVNKAADVLVDLSKRGVKVMVHCHHGKDRSVFVAMMYLSKRHGIGYPEAFDIIRKGRPRAVYHQEWVDVLQADR
jgi:predicted protein tyrosine phosphatase